MKNNYGNEICNERQNRADYCVKVDRSYLRMDKLKKISCIDGRLFYLYDGEIRVNERDVMDKPRCDRAPQHTENFGRYILFILNLTFVF